MVNKRYECDYCHHSFHKYVNLQEHTERRHPDMIIDPNKEGGANYDDPIVLGDDNE